MKVKSKYMHYVKYGVNEGVLSGLLENTIDSESVFNRMFHPHDQRKTSMQVFCYFYNIGFNHALTLKPLLDSKQVKQWLIDNNYLTEV